MAKEIIFKIFVLIMVILIIFNFGRLYQQKEDREVFDEVLISFNELQEEYTYYKAHSWTLSSYDK